MKKPNQLPNDYSDLHEYLAGPLTIPSTPHAVTGATLPVTLGHEFSGTVEEVGADTTTRLKAGDRVAVKPNLYDGSCASCLMGRVNCCRNLGFIGYSSELSPLGLSVAWFADGDYTSQAMPGACQTMWSSRSSMPFRFRAHFPWI